VAALVIATAVTIPVIAQPPQGRGGPGGPGGPLLRGLTLSDAQREQIRSIGDQQRAQANPPQQKVAELRKQLQLAILADSPDPQKIEELKTSIAAAAAEALTARIDVESRIVQVLTPEQRAQARDTLANAGPMAGGPTARGRRGGGGF
jgi:Spy/CpxP family protein refolding chaperone